MTRAMFDPLHGVPAHAQLGAVRHRSDLARYVGETFGFDYDTRFQGELA